MSSDQQQLSAFQSAEPSTPPGAGDDSTHPQETASLTAWRPENKDHCRGCGGHVTPQFRKSLGDENGVAHACRGCVSADDLLKGAAADPDYESRVDESGSTTMFGGVR